MTMKLLVLSDLHLEFGPLELDAERCGAADVIVLAGDTDILLRGIAWADQLSRRLKDKPVIMLAGNHEFYGGGFNSVLHNMRLTACDTSVHVLEDQALILDGVRFLGATLWTDFKLEGEGSAMLQALSSAHCRMADYRSISFDQPDLVRALQPEDTQARHLASRAWLAAQLKQDYPGPTVVVSHHAPSPLSLPSTRQNDPLAPAYASQLEALMLQGPELWIHGHIHSSSDYVVNRTRILCNPRGYTPMALNSGFEPYKIVSV
jgi:3',5'-cyclic AMP phosphodiesterase CpdA